MVEGTPSSSSPRSTPDLVEKTDVSENVKEKDGLNSEIGGPSAPQPQKKGLRFWLVFLAVCASVFLSALELTSVSTALPTITNDLQGTDFVWVVSAYSLAATSLIPLSGGIAEIFGRRLAMLSSLALFALGSALCGSAKNMNWLIAGRTIQGAGSGSSLSLSSIIISDLVTLRERGTYNGLIGLTWAVAASMAPIVGGSLAKEGQWRWLFYLNIPITGLSFALVLFFLKLRTPEGTLREKLGRMDWIGNAIITGSSASVVIALTWGGIQFPWKDARVLVPLIVGVLGMGAFFVYEFKFATNPIVPITLVSNRTSLSGYVQTFINPLVILCGIYYMSTYYQACYDASPVRAGAYSLGAGAPLGLFIVLIGTSVAITKSYRVQIWFGWACVLISMGLMSTLKHDSPVSKGVGYPTLAGIGGGAIYATTYFPVLAPLPISQNAYALALFSFFRSFANVWGVTIGAAVLQNQLSSKLPEAFLELFPEGASIIYAAVPVIRDLPEPTRTQVQVAFAESLSDVWKVMAGITAIGLIASLFMKGLPLHTQVDEKWGLEDEKKTEEPSEA